MNCRDFKEQFEDNLDLGKPAKAHLESCVDCQLFQRESLQLSQMISSLPKVEAPKDFEFGFKAKLAQSKLKKPLSPFWQTLRYLLPLTAAALIFGFVFVNSNIFAPTQTQQIAEKKQNVEQKETPTNEDSIDETSKPSDELVTENSDKSNQESTSDKVEKKDLPQEKKPALEVAENKPKTIEKKDSEKDKILSRDIRPETGSSKLFDKDSAVTAPKIVNPRGINSNKKITKQMSQTATSFTAKEVLSQLGIETKNKNGRLTVDSVRQNSAGANSGVKIGDIVTAIDGQTLTAKPLQNRTVQGKTLKVQRDEIDLIIKIRNN